jgi:hypothetical protein
MSRGVPLRQRLDFGGATMGRLQLRIVLSINTLLACLALWVMSVDVLTKNNLTPSLAILAISYLVVSCFLALGADWARVVSAGLSAIVIIASFTILLTGGGLNVITFVSLAFALIFFSSAYLLYFSKPMQAELRERWIQQQVTRQARHARL